MQKNKMATKVASKKKVIENKVSKKKIIVPKEPRWGAGLSLVEELKNKCVVRLGPSNGAAMLPIDGDLGFIAVLAFNDLQYKDVTITNENEVCYEFAKKDTKKIQALEKAYFLHKIKMDAKEITEVTTVFANLLLYKGLK